MKILMVTPSFMPALNYGGTTRSIYELCKSLVEKNNLLVLTTNLNGVHKMSLVPDILQECDGIPVVYHDVHFFKKMFCSSRFLLNILNEVPRSDVIHIQSVFFLPAIFTAVVCKIYKKPFYVSTRGEIDDVRIRRKSRLLKIIWIRVNARQLLHGCKVLHLN